MNSPRLVFPSAASIPASLYEETNSAVKFRAWATLFNNITYLVRSKGYYTFTSTSEVARGISKAGFDVYDLGNGAYGAKRGNNTTVVA